MDEIGVNGAAEFSVIVFNFSQFSVFFGRRFRPFLYYSKFVYQRRQTVIL